VSRALLNEKIASIKERFQREKLEREEDYQGQIMAKQKANDPAAILELPLWLAYAAMFSKSYRYHTF
jgi:hypothetical protein